VTIYEPNPEVHPTGAEVDEFDDAPEPHPSEPPRAPGAASDGATDPDRAER
jgi:hypothetical protein